MYGAVPIGCGTTPWYLLLAEGLAVGALIHHGVGLVGAHQNPIQGTVILLVAVISTLLNGTFDTLICLAVHRICLLFIWVRTYYALIGKRNTGIFFIFLQLKCLRDMIKKKTRRFLLWRK
jgi:hypothetical protein